MSLEELCSASCDSAQRVEGLQQQNVQQELHKVLVLQGKEEFGLAGRSVFQQDVLSSLLDLQS